MRGTLAIAGVTAAVAASAAAIAALAGLGGVAIALAAGIPVVVIPAVAVVSLAPSLERHRGRVVRGVLSVAVVAVVVAVALSVAVLVMGHLPDDRQRRFVLPAAAAAAVAAVAYAPARRRVADTAERLSGRRGIAATDVIRSFGDRTARDVPDEEVLLQLADALRRSMALRAAEVWTLTGHELRRTVAAPVGPAAAVELDARQVRSLSGGAVLGRAWLDLWLPELLDGRRGGDARVVPATHAGELTGVLVLERRADAVPFSPEDDRTLVELGRRVGVVLHNRQLDSALRATLADLRRSNQDLAASRARLVAAADAERRRLERDLHDGAQQNLLALAVNLRRARDVLADDPGGATELLDQLTGDVRTTIQELRDLAHGIYPPLLLESGLGPALKGAAARIPTRVTVDAELDRRYPPEIEAAVYFSCLEALQNVVKHAPGSPANVRLCRDGALLRFEVSDEGAGFDAAAATTGLGLQNIRDRVGAVGGTVEWRGGERRGMRMLGAAPAEVSP
jgi:signal transduction histidine kinase